MPPTLPLPSFRPPSAAIPITHAKNKRRKRTTRVNAKPGGAPEVGASVIGEAVSGLAAQLAVRELYARRWHHALDYVRQANGADREVVQEVISEASFRLARRAVVNGDFATARRYSEQAVGRPVPAEVSEQQVGDPRPLR